MPLDPSFAPASTRQDGQRDPDVSPDPLTEPPPAASPAPFVARRSGLSIWDLLRPHQAQLWLGLVAITGESIADVLGPWPLKLVLDDGSWVCYRLSGTEPVVRAYTESRNEADMAELSKAAEHFVLS